MYWSIKKGAFILGVSWPVRWMYNGLTSFMGFMWGTFNGLIDCRIFGSVIRTVQNFLLGGEWYFSWKLPAKMHTRLRWSLRKILVPPHSLCQKLVLPPPLPVLEANQGNKGKSRESCIQAPRWMLERANLLFLCLKNGYPLSAPLQNIIPPFGKLIRNGYHPPLWVILNSSLGQMSVQKGIFLLW